MNLTVHGNRHLGGDDVVLCIRVVGQVQAKEVGVRVADQFWMNSAEFTVGTGIAKVKRKLLGLRLDCHRVGAGRSEVDRAPSFGAEDTQSEAFCSDQKNRGDAKT